MKAVVQRVRSASVEIENQIMAYIQQGLLILLGVARGDAETDGQYIADKICHLRIFSDEAGKMNKSVLDVKGQVLLVSQFTLLGDTHRGRRPEFSEAAVPELALIMYEGVVRKLRAQDVIVHTGVFGASMLVSLQNDGPVTLILDSCKGKASTIV